MSLTPGLNLPFGIQPVNPLPVDSWSGPYTGLTEAEAVAAANSAITPAIRFQTMEARIVVAGVGKKFWYKDGIADNDLIEFFSDGNSGFLAISGGTVTGDTVFTTNVSANTLTLTTTNVASPLNLPVFSSDPISPNHGDAWITTGGTSVFFNVRIGAFTKTVELT